MRVIVTRPERDALAWVRGLQQAGLQPVALPLIEVCPVDDPVNVRAAWRHLPALDAVMFVSGNAVEHFFAFQPSESVAFTARSATKTRAFVTGPGSRAALLRAGVEAVCIDAPEDGTGQFDSEALWARVAHRVQPGFRVLIVRGTVDARAGIGDSGSGRDWFAEQVMRSGGQVEFVVAYQRRSPRLSADQLAMARSAASDGAIWLFSSSEAIANLRDTVSGVSWAQARCVVTHPRIARAAQSAGFGVVCESRPLLAAVVASIESLQ